MSKKHNSTGSMRGFFTLAALAAMFMLMQAHAALAAQWVDDPADCAYSYYSQDCTPDRVCGFSSPTTYCYDTTAFSPPPATRTSESGDTYQATLGGGFILDCQYYDGSVPHCDNSGSFWCNRNNTCYTTYHRSTNCTGGSWAVSECHTCLTGYTYCDASYTDPDGCEVQINVTNCATGANNTINSSCDCACDSGYYDCDASGTDAGNGCERLNASACIDAGTGLTGTWNGPTCTCLVSKSYFQTGTYTKYSTTDSLLWGLQAGSGNMMNLSNGTASFVINNDGCLVFKDSTNLCTAASIGGGGNTTAEIRAAINGSDSWFSNVGVGTASPTAKLDVNSTIRISNGSADSGRLEFGSADSYFQQSTDRLDLYGYNGGYNHSMTWTGLGLVGIGTASPSTFLHVYRNTSTAYDVAGATALNYLELENPNTVTGTGTGIEFRTGTGVSRIGSIQTGGSRSDIVFATRDTNVYERMRITYSGYVGIGSSNPQYKLEINAADKALNVSNFLFVNSTVVGVGTSNPSSALGVSGNVSATNVIASTGMTLGGAYRTSWPTSSGGNTTDEIRAAINGSDIWHNTVAIGAPSVQNATLLVNGSMLQTARDPRLAGLYTSSTYLSIFGKVYVSGRYAYVASGNNPYSLTIIDVSNPASPAYVGNYSNSTYINGDVFVYVSGKYAYVVSQPSNSLAIIDVSNPASPAYAGSYVSPAYLNGAHSVYVSGKYAYVASYVNDSLTVIDVSNPASPAFASWYSSSTYLDGAMSIYVSGKYAYVAAGSIDTLTVIDVSNPAIPTYVANYSSSTYLDSAYSVYVSGKYAYVAALASSSLTIIDVSNPANPAYAGSYVSPAYLNGANSVYVSGKYAYVASYNNDSLTVIDVSNPASPAFTGWYSSSTYLDTPFSVYVSGKYAYVTSSASKRLTVLDISGIDAPAATIGDLAVGTIDVWENADVKNDLSVGSGLVVGASGVYSQGNVTAPSITATAGITLGGVTRTTWPSGQGNTSTEMRAAVNGSDSWFTSVGIGTASPAEKLEVNGSIRMNWNENTYVAWNYTPVSGYEAGMNFPSGGRGITLFSKMNDGNSYVSFKTGTIASFSEKMRITNAGYVGIATTAPADLFHINGTTGGTDPSMRVSNNINNYLQLKMGGTTAGEAWYVHGNSSANINTPSGVNLSFNIGGTGDVMRITSGGNVGIGTASPDSKLDVAGNVIIQAANIPWGEGLSIDSSDGTWGGIKWRTIGRTGNVGNWQLGYDDSHSSATDSNLYLYNGEDNYITAWDYDTGNVGIGTTNPGSKLEVAGTFNVTDSTNASIRVDGTGNVIIQLGA